LDRDLETSIGFRGWFVKIRLTVGVINVISVINVILFFWFCGVVDDEIRDLWDHEHDHDNPCD
jgi:hypothetical protein